MTARQAAPTGARQQAPAGMRREAGPGREGRTVTVLPKGAVEAGLKAAAVTLLRASGALPRAAVGEPLVAIVGGAR